MVKAFEAWVNNGSKGQFVMPDLPPVVMAQFVVPQYVPNAASGGGENSPSTTSHHSSPSVFYMGGASPPARLESLTVSVAG